MKLIEAYTGLRKLNISAFQTHDAAAYFDISLTHASKLLSRLANAKQIIHLSKGTWVFPEIDRLTLPIYLTSPFPTYLSLQTALYYHSMISQIPDKIYAVSLARTKLHSTLLGTVSIHHIQPSFFFGFEEKNDLVKIAIPEKALLDIFYLSSTKTQLFSSLPEIELPKNFNFTLMKKFIDKIPSQNKRTLLANKITMFEKALKMRGNR